MNARRFTLVVALSVGCASPLRSPSVTSDDVSDAAPVDAALPDVVEDLAPPRDVAPPRDAAVDVVATDTPRDVAVDTVALDRPDADVAPADVPSDAAPETSLDAVVDAFDDVVDAEPVDALAAPIEVIITADNAYSFGFGTESSIVTYVRGSRATTAGQIFNCPVGVGPEAYTIPSDVVPSTSHIYIVSWDDLSVTQGVLGQFGRGGRLL